MPSTLRRYERSTYLAQIGPDARRALGAGSRGPLPYNDDPPPEWNRGAEAGYAGQPPASDDERYLAGHRYGRGCLRRREQVRGCA